MWSVRSVLRVATVCPLLPCELVIFTLTPMNHGHVRKAATSSHDQPSTNYREHEHTAAGWRHAKDLRVRRAGFLPGAMPCHMQQGLGGSSGDAFRHTEQRARATLKVKSSAIVGFFCGYFPRKANKRSDRCTLENE